MGMKNKKKSKVKMGRPPKKPNEVLSEIVCIRLTKGERNLLETEARQQGITVKELLMKPYRSRE